MRILQLTPRRRELRQVAIGILLLALLVWTGIRTDTIDEAWFWSIGLLGVLTLGYFLVYSRRVGTPSRLLLSRRGVRFDDPTIDRGWIQWSRIDRAEYHWFSGTLCVVGTDGGQLLTTRYERLGSSPVARECADAINEYLRRYCPDRDGPA
jgi:hypothetical protein